MLIIFSNCSLAIVLISLDFTLCIFFLLLFQLKYHALFSQHVCLGRIIIIVVVVTFLETRFHCLVLADLNTNISTAGRGGARL